MSTRMSLFTSNEDYNDHYKSLNVKNKIVLDLGADWGSTAVHFLNQGAKYVIAVEGNNISDFAGMIWLINDKPEYEGRIIPIWMFLESAEDYECLISRYKPDIVKVDIEGCERFMSTIDPDILRMVPFYAVEFHDWGEEEAVTKHFIDCGFKLVERFGWSSIGYDALVYISYFFRV